MHSGLNPINSTHARTSKARGQIQVGEEPGQGHNAKGVARLSFEFQVTANRERKEKHAADAR